jgi:hypothetical protein
MKQWSQRLSRQQLTFEYFSTSSRDSFISWCNIKVSADSGYGSDSSDSDVLSFSSKSSSVAASGRPMTSRSLLSSKASEGILSGSLLDRPKTAVARLLHTSVSGRRGIKTATRKVQVPLRARTADGYIHGIRLMLDETPAFKQSSTAQQDETELENSEEVEKNVTQSQPLTVDQFLDTRKKSNTFDQLQVDQIPPESENTFGLQAEGLRDASATSRVMKDATSRWDDALHENAIAHPSNYDWMDRNVRFAIVGNNQEFAVERELLKRDCIPRMKDAMWQLGYTLEMVMNNNKLRCFCFLGHPCNELCR